MKSLFTKRILSKLQYTLDLPGFLREKRNLTVNQIPVNRGFTVTTCTQLSLQPSAPKA